MVKLAVVIGSGVGGLASAALLAKAGYRVTVYEARSQVGGRMGLLQKDGFRFDTGPSWYLMPEVFEHFFALCGHKVTDLYKLQRLSPAYQVFFESLDRPIIVSGNEMQDKKVFERLEAGAGQELEKYIDSAEAIYKLALQYFLYHDFRLSSLRKLARPEVLRRAPAMLQAGSRPLHTIVSRHFKRPELQQLLEYAAVFLGTSPFTAPSLYHLMSYLDFRQGVYYPEGGLYSVTQALQKVAEEAGVTIHTDSPVTEILRQHNRVSGVRLESGETVAAEIVVSNADLHYTQMQLLTPEARDYPEQYWQAKEAGPSAMLIYLGVQGSLLQLKHHNLFLVRDWKENFETIFNKQVWPERPSIYVCKPSATDKTVAPPDHENIFVLVPLPAKPDLHATEFDTYADKYLVQIADEAGIPDLQQRIVRRTLYGPADFATDLHAWQGTALGLSHRLTQSALFRPRVKSKKTKGLYYVGGNVQPGIGVPMCLIGAEIIYKDIIGDRSLGPIGVAEP